MVQVLRIGRERTIHSLFSLSLIYFIWKKNMEHKDPDL